MNINTSVIIIEKCNDCWLGIPVPVNECHLIPFCHCFLIHLPSEGHDHLVCQVSVSIQRSAH